MEIVLKIDDRDVGFKATALTPRIYRHKMGRDMVQDMNKLSRAYNKVLSLPKDASEEEKMDAQLSALDLEIFENVAWVMAKQYDRGIEDTPENWLDTFKMFSIYEILPHILNLWGLNNKTTSVPKKK